MDLSNKIGGRNKGKKALKVYHVEDQVCPDHDDYEKHLIINDGEQMICRWCRVSWADLDAQLNGAVR